jgi:UPF0042 nucleotide-binding protein
MTTSLKHGPAASSDAGTAGAARPAVLLVSGLSGAGRSTALKILEDLGYEAVDNLPLGLLGGLAADHPVRPLAIGIDSRTRGFTPSALLARLDRLRQDGLGAKLLYLVCDDAVLARRFTETRRRHPLAMDRPVADGIRQERLLLEPLHRRADLVIDTSALSIGELKQLLGGHFASPRPAATVAVTSFSYRAGLPREADLVFDVRFLGNPHYVEALRPLTGRDPAVAGFIEADPAFVSFFAALTALLSPLLPLYEREGKTYLTIAIGCTGGRHRSVFVAERLAAWLGREGREVVLRHRDQGEAPDETG